MGVKGVPPDKFKWKKGQSGNPSGKQKLPADLRSVAMITSEELKRLISKHFRFKIPELHKIVEDPESPAINVVLASTILEAAKKGDVQRAEYLFMRLVGRVTEKVEVQYPEPVVIERPNGEQMVLDVASEDVE